MDKNLKSEKRNKNDRGMTLIEMMICIFLISVGVLAVMKMQVTAMFGNARAMKVSEATISVEDVIDTILGIDIDDTTSTAVGLTSGLTAGSYSTTAGDNNRYTINYTIQDITGVDPDDTTATILKYKQITVTTTWDNQGKTMTMTNNFIKI